MNSKNMRTDDYHDMLEISSKGRYNGIANRLRLKINDYEIRTSREKYMQRIASKQKEWKIKQGYELFREYICKFNENYDDLTEVCKEEISHLVSSNGIAIGSNLSKIYKDAVEELKRGRMFGLSDKDNDKDNMRKIVEVTNEIVDKFIFTDISVLFLNDINKEFIKNKKKIRKCYILTRYLNEIIEKIKKSESCYSFIEDSKLKKLTKKIKNRLYKELDLNHYKPEDNDSSELYKSKLEYNKNCFKKKYTILMKELYEEIFGDKCYQNECVYNNFFLEVSEELLKELRVESKLIFTYHCRYNKIIPCLNAMLNETYVVDHEKSEASTNINSEIATKEKIEEYIILQIMRDVCKKLEKNINKKYNRKMYDNLYKIFWKQKFYNQYNLESDRLESDRASEIRRALKCERIDKKTNYVFMENMFDKCAEILQPNNKKEFINECIMGEENDIEIPILFEMLMIDLLKSESYKENIENFIRQHSLYFLIQALNKMDREDYKDIILFNKLLNFDEDYNSIVDEDYNSMVIRNICNEYEEQIRKSFEKHYSSLRGEGNNLIGWHQNFIDWVLQLLDDLLKLEKEFLQRKENIECIKKIYELYDCLVSIPPVMSQPVDC